MKVLIAIIILFLSVIGLTEVIKFLTVKFFTVKPSKNFYIIIPIDGESNNIEVELRDIAVYLQYQKIKREAVFVFLKNSSPEKIKICQKLCDEYGFFYIIDQRVVDTVKST